MAFKPLTQRASPASPKPQCAFGQTRRQRRRLVCSARFSPHSAEPRNRTPSDTSESWGHSARAT
ncbi:uncharacterized protein K489DRAFT_382032 [Dissoconium aciculare CBS 342.82]|uniref:Uncharacterized protein n=1 Tax=Dissoconium aciculare CBS 342.82 TaxID=1314786 RepID=A0A6J3M237_9PEZI|nr:uncharacterized protein K489DRAFT_382032 [Dissoconium aciculare CBS 342.82]KAF1820987.1 hypothetical protein K489DRAFT_382032 [Dissoconium aciculare CBS 342.82]